MSKKLTSTKYPFLPLSIHVRVSSRKHIDLNTQALIDTGFSCDIVVPVTEELKQPTPDAYATWTMADGSEVMAPIFLGTIRFPELDEDVADVARHRLLADDQLLRDRPVRLALCHEAEHLELSRAEAVG